MIRISLPVSGWRNGRNATCACWLAQYLFAGRETVYFGLSGELASLPKADRLARIEAQLDDQQKHPGSTPEAPRQTPHQPHLEPPPRNFFRVDRNRLNFLCVTHSAKQNLGTKG